MTIFHAYDIRGVYSDELNADTAYKIGRAVVMHLKADTVLVGYDMRTSSPELRDALIEGITDQGANVVEIGLCSTPMFYWTTQEYEAGVMVTASHNPAKYNGFKICKDGAVPVGGDSGLKEIEELVLENEFPEAQKGETASKEILHDFIQFSLSFLHTDKPFKIVVDAANGMGGYTYEQLMKELPEQITIIPMYMEPDGTFPNHEANPLKSETLKDLQKKVVEEKAELGVGLDGDGDRVGFVDENGNIVPLEFTTALIAGQILEEHPGSNILYDIRSSRAVAEEILAHGGNPIMTRVGHSLIKLDMIKHNGMFAGEISGHYFNHEQQNTENTMIIFFRLLNLLASSGKTMSELVEPLKRYFKSPETNFSVDDKQGKIDAIKEEYGNIEGAKVSTMDGVRIDFPDWWLSVRASNTEPLLRLIVEAKTQELLDEKVAELSSKIQT